MVFELLMNLWIKLPSVFDKKTSFPLAGDEEVRGHNEAEGLPQILSITGIKFYDRWHLNKPSFPIRTFLAALLFNLLPGVVSVVDAGKIFHWVDNNGKKHFTDDPSKIPNKQPALKNKPRQKQGVEKEIPKEKKPVTSPSLSSTLSIFHEPEEDEKTSTPQTPGAGPPVQYPLSEESAGNMENSPESKPTVHTTPANKKWQKYIGKDDAEQNKSFFKRDNYKTLETVWDPLQIAGKWHGWGRIVLQEGGRSHFYEGTFDQSLSGALGQLEIRLTSRQNREYKGTWSVPGAQKGHLQFRVNDRGNEINGTWCGITSEVDLDLPSCINPSPFQWKRLEAIMTPFGYSKVEGK